MKKYQAWRNCREAARRLGRGVAVAALLSVAASAAELELRIEPRWRAEALTVPSPPLTNDAGQTLRVTRLALLLSGAELLRADGSRVQLENQYGFIEAESGRRSFTLRGVPPGDYVGLEFSVGVPPNVNHADPGTWPAGHALNPLVNGLHWSWQGGYVFAALEGRWAERRPDDAGERGFSYHLATDARRIRVRFAANFSLGPAPTAVALAVDVARVLAGRKFVANDGSETTHSAEGDTLAPQLGAAFERAWFWLEVQPSDSGRDGAGATNAIADIAAPSSRTETTPYAFTIPVGFPQPALPVDNALTVEGIALGERLFTDARLSGNGTQSCASCHAPERAFSDRVALSRGAEGELGARNAMPLVNLAWSPHFAWDGSQPRIRDQALAAWTNPLEMHGAPAEVAAALAREPGLVADFTRAFGAAENAITPERITLALEQYLLARVGADSKFDRALRGAAELSEEEKRGFALFATEYDPTRGRRGADCFHCHGGALFTDFALKNNGLERVSRDGGRAAVTGAASDRGKFKTPSLRNVAVTAPYMHDGRFATLEEAVAHYDHGVQRSAALDPNLAKHPDAGLALTADEQRALVAFLRTLTDESYLAASPAPSGP